MPSCGLVVPLNVGGLASVPELDVGAATSLHVPASHRVVIQVQIVIHPHGLILGGSFDCHPEKHRSSSDDSVVMRNLVETERQGYTHPDAAHDLVVADIDVAGAERGVRFIAIGHDPAAIPAGAALHKIILDFDWMPRSAA